MLEISGGFIMVFVIIYLIVYALNQAFGENARTLRRIRKTLRNNYRR